VLDKCIDWWTLGVLLYEMLSGLPPFYDGPSPSIHPPIPIATCSKLPSLSPEVTDRMYEKILQDPLVFGSEISSEAQSILTGLLTRDPAKRLGVNGAEEIKRHPFFGNHIDFARLLEKKIQPPFKPSVASPVDVSNFDTVFTTEPALDSLVEDSHLSQTVQAQFAGKRTNRMFFFGGRSCASFDRFLLQWDAHARQPRLTISPPNTNRKCIPTQSFSTFMVRLISLSPHRSHSLAPRLYSLRRTLLQYLPRAPSHSFDFFCASDRQP
jgi:serine/threonine protein kinase